MGIRNFFGNLFRADTPGPLDDFWYRDAASGYVYGAGQDMNPDTAMKVVAVMACVRCISNTIGTSPLITYREIGDGEREQAKNHKVYNLLHKRPNKWQTPFEFKRQMMTNVLLRGNAYAKIIWDVLGNITDLIPLHPDKMTVEQLPNYSLRYTYRAYGEPQVFPQSQILHLRDYSDDGIKGMTRIRLHARSIGLSVSSEEHSSNVFESGGTKRMILKHPSHFKDRETARKVAESFDRLYAGNHKTGIIEDGMDATVTGMSAEDEQLIESRQFSIEEICRIFQVPPHKIQHLLRATNNNIEHQGMEYHTDTILPWFTLFEESCDRDLFSEGEEEYFCEFNADAILRADILSRYNAYGSAIDKGWMNRNQARRKENLPPADGLDDYLYASNMLIVGKEPKQPEKPKPVKSIPNNLEEIPNGEDPNQNA